jgi:hypothetical protein
MAITLKTDPDKGWKTAQLFNVDPGLIAQAKATGKIQIAMPKLGTYVVKNDVTIFGTIPIASTALSLAQQKAMGPASLNQYKSHFENALKKAIEATKASSGGYVPEVTQASPYPDDDEPMAAPPSALFGPSGKTKPPMAPKVVPPVPMDAQHKGAPVKLYNATDLYQPVLGTGGPNSIYYTFALFPGLKLAAKIMGKKLSVRAEGHNLSTYLDQLKEQFKMDNNGSYASAHYIVDEGAGLMVKTLAGIIGVLGFEKIEKVADLNKFVKDQA